MEDVSELQRRMRILERAFARMPNVKAHFKSPRLERLQALLALGDRRLAPVLVRMARGEADLRRALSEEKLDLDFYIHRRRSRDELLPWGHIDNGMKGDLLEDQYEKALAAVAPAPAIG